MSTATSNNAGGIGRSPSVDLLRGFAMLLVALDLVRYYTFDGVHLDPMNLKETWTGLFFSRWVTHYFAPLFLLLGGTSAFFKKAKGASTKQLSLFLLTRGIFLIALEVLVVGLLWKFHLNIYPIYLQVIWVLGASMVVLSALVWLPLPAIAGFALAVIFGHNLLDNVSLGQGWWENIVWGLIHQETAVCLDICQYSKKEVYYAFISYPLLPWSAVVALGYALGSLYVKPAEVRRKYLLYGGILTTVLFILVRAINGYGNPKPWAEQGTFLYTLMSFLNAEKYPPSLSYLLMTLGPAMLLLAWFEGKKLRLLEFIRVFGRVPLFAYLVFFLFAHTVAVIIGITQGFPAEKLMTVPWRFPREYGVGLGSVYLIWIGAVILLYPICEWYGDLKGAGRNKFLSYL